MQTAPTGRATRSAATAMAVYISRALAQGDANVPAGPTQPSFSDVPASDWAYKYIEYAKSQQVVQGDADGHFNPARA